MPIDAALVKLLTIPEQKFVGRYLETLNPEEAAREAGIDPGVAKKLLAKKRIRDVLTRLRSESAASLALNADWVLHRLYTSVTADLADIFDAQGGIKPIDRWPELWRQGLVSGFESEEITDEDGVVTGVMRKVKLADRTKLLEMLGKHVKIKAFQENIAIAGVSELAERLNRAAKAIDAEKSMTMIEHRPEETA